MWVQYNIEFMWLKHCKTKYIQNWQKCKRQNLITIENVNMSLSKFKMNRYNYEIKDLNTVRLNSLQVEKKCFLPVVHKSLTSH